MIVGAFVLAAFEEAEQVAVAQGGGELDEVLKAGGVAGAFGRGDGHVEFHEAALVVVEGETGHFIGAAPHLHGGSLGILANGVVAEGHGGDSGRAGDEIRKTSKRAGGGFIVDNFRCG